MVNLFSLLLFNNFLVAFVWCLENPSVTPEHSEYVENGSKVFCFNAENIFPSDQLKSCPISPSDKLLMSMKKTFLAMADNLEGVHSKKAGTVPGENPNSKQALMSRTFIDSSNYIFQRNDEIGDDIDTIMSFSKNTLKLNKLPKIKFNFQNKLHESLRSKRDAFNENCDNEDAENSTEEGSFEGDKKDKSRESLDPDEMETRVHCVKTGSSEIVCKHDNYSYTFKLPVELFKKPVMENLVASVCSIVEEASPDAKGHVEVAVNKVARNEGLKIRDEDEIRTDNTVGCKAEIRESKDELEDPSSKVIRINIPIDFNTIPLGQYEGKLQLENSDKQFYPVQDLVRTTDQEVLTPKWPIFRENRNDDSYFMPLKSNAAETQSMVRSNNLYSCNKPNEEFQDKLFNKRDSKTNSLFPPSLIMLKRSPQRKHINDMLFQKRNENHKICKRETLADVLMKMLVSNKTCSCKESFSNANIANMGKET